mgnify:CR=1 FL=1|jgi:hypothetical protein
MDTRLLSFLPAHEDDDWYALWRDGVCGVYAPDGQDRPVVPALSCSRSSALRNSGADFARSTATCKFRKTCRAISEAVRGGER